jgi:glucose-6-phosphate dehydrogenase assembly protein OpcA
MSVRLDGTTAAQVARTISEERFRQGSSAVGRVLTLVIVADEATQADAVHAAAKAAREHPCRILTAIPRPGHGPAQLDAEITVGGADGLGELAVLRLRGPLSHHAESVVLPLLVPDAPVVVWWPAGCPSTPGDDPIGALAQRRITDSAEHSRPLKLLQDLADGYTHGDTDLAWTRITPWRALLASALDEPYDPITHVDVHAPKTSPSAALLVSWLEGCLKVPVAIRQSKGPGITGVDLHTVHGDIVVSRPDGRVAAISRPGMPDREAALPRRSVESLIAEELRRLDPDDIYEEVLARFAASALTTSAPAKKAVSTPRSDKPAPRSVKKS